MTLDVLSAKLKKITLPIIQKNVEEMVVADKEILKRKKAELKAGVNPDGSLIGSYASESYALFKQNLNPIAQGNVDLILTGESIDGAKVESLGKGKFKVDIPLYHEREIIRDYGEQVEGINEKVFIGYQKRRYAPRLIKRMQKFIGI